MFADYAPEAWVVVPVDDLSDGEADLAIRTVEALLPNAAWHADDGV